uniref:Peptidyl-prolyl cis-trans isomerase n=1 Tax=Thermofilum pendens TaxID=2269 RepID=A0A7C1TA72_THEPE
MSERTVARGDFVLVKYTISLMEEAGERVIASTAHEEGATTHEEPELVIVGEGFLLSAIEEALIGMREGESKEVVLEPSQAFGERDPGNIVVLPARELSSRGVVPRVGEEVEVDGRRGRVIRVGGGRVTIDFNHPFAGKKVKARITVQEIVEDDRGKITELLCKWFRGLPKDRVSVKIDGEAVEVEVPGSIFAYSNAHILLSGFLRDVERYVPSISRVRLVEEFKFERKKEEKSIPEASGEASA